MAHQQNPDSPPPVNSPPDPAATLDDAQLTLGAWLVRNGPLLVFLITGLGLLYWWLDLEGVWTVAKVTLGLGLVIFVHELGHFLVAKWCDVNVQTFSLGFGPALPGCSFKWGETTYKIALLPLGGYVKMLGEGGENDEEDIDPRSFKNKNVGQRMAIISAGVVLNILFGMACFIVAYKMGVHKVAPVISLVESGSPAWIKGVRTGDVIKQVDDISNPYFEDLKIAVMLSRGGERTPFVFQTPGQEPRQVFIEARKLPNDSNPVIGVRWPMAMSLLSQSDLKGVSSLPARKGSPAALARILNLQPGEQVVALIDPDQPERPLPISHYRDLAEHFRRLAGRSFELQVQSKDSPTPRTVSVPPVGFQFEDAIIGTSDPGADDPFLIAPLLTDPRDPQGRHLDFFEFLRRLQRLEGRPIVIRVRRKKVGEEEPTANIFVPPSHHRVLPGVRMKMGEVVALREGSSAQAAGVKPRDVITRVALTQGSNQIVFAVDPAPDGKEKQLDPVRLPFDLRTWAQHHPGATASVTVKHVAGTIGDAVQDYHGLKWDDSWEFDEEMSLGVKSPLAIPELGLAYQVKALVEYVEPGSQADQKGLRKGDTILAVQWPLPAGVTDDRETWPEKARLTLLSPGDPSPDPSRWAEVSLRMQELEIPKVKLLVRGNAGSVPSESLTKKDVQQALKMAREVELDLGTDPDWPLHDAIEPRGLLLRPSQDRIAIADNFLGAIRMGFRDTYRTVVQIYLSLRSLVTRRVSAMEHLQGPIDIFAIAYKVAERNYLGDLALLLGIIGVNLAVVNFLPIPVLDGGHMLFLIYEKLRGRPASETIRLAANWFGLVVLVSLMGFVIYLGVVRLL